MKNLHNIGHHDLYHAVQFYREQFDYIELQFNGTTLQLRNKGGFTDSSGNFIGNKWIDVKGTEIVTLLKEWEARGKPRYE